MTMDSPKPANPAPVLAIVLVLVTGVFTGAQLGKIAPLLTWYQQDVALSLVAAGWLAAILGLFIAVVALPAGWLIDRLGLVRSILAGTLALALGGTVLALSTTPSILFAARLVEALGYLALCIALPAVLAVISPPAWKGPVLAIWSGFVPLGFATSDMLAGAMLPEAVPSTYLLTMTLLFAALAMLTLLRLRRVSTRPEAGIESGGFGATLTAPVILLSLGFGAFVVVSVSMFTFLPTLVAQDGDRFLISAGSIALCVPLGNLVAGVLVHGRGARFMVMLAITGFAASAVMAVPAFTLDNAPLATAAVLLLAISGAFVASAQFAAIPFITPRAGSVSVAIGLVCQAGGIGTVFGPPAAAAIIERFGWNGLGLFLALVAISGLACMVPILSGTRRAAGVSAAGARQVP